jgi:hypothetical protein
MGVIMTITHKEEILKELYFGPLRTTEILTCLHNRGVSIGAEFTRRLRELQEEGKIVGIRDDYHKENLWKIVRTDKCGQRILI